MKDCGIPVAGKKFVPAATEARKVQVPVPINFTWPDADTVHLPGVSEMTEVAPLPSFVNAGMKLFPETA